jgi:hypothetical protein
VLHDGCRPVSLEASPCSPEPQEKTQRKIQRSVKSDEEGAEKQEEHKGKIGKIDDQLKMQEEHQWWDTDRKDGTHQTQHLVMSASYERLDPNNDNPYALRYNIRKTHSTNCVVNLVRSRGARSTSHTAKKTNAGAIEHLATKTLKMNTTLKGRRRLNVNQISGSRNRLSPKVRCNRGDNHKSTTSLKQMTMLALSNPILSMSTRARKLSWSTLLSKHLAKSIREILYCRIRTKYTNRSVKMSTNHSREILIDG